MHLWSRHACELFTRNFVKLRTRGGRPTRPNGEPSKSAEIAKDPVRNDRALAVFRIQKIDIKNLLLFLQLKAANPEHFSSQLLEADSDREQKRI